MRLSQRLCNQHLGWLSKLMWQRRTQRLQVKPRLTVAAILKDRDIVDPLVDWVPKKEKWRPPVDDPSWENPDVTVNKDELSVDWNDEPTYVMRHDVRMMEGLKQASILTKSHIIYDWPSSVERLIPTEPCFTNQDLLVQRLILQSHKWDNTADKLPRRSDPEMPWKYVFPREFGIPESRRRDVFLRGLLQLCSTLNSWYPSILSKRRIAERPFIASNYIIKDNKRIVIQNETNKAITSDRLLTPFADDDTIDATVQHKLPDLWPIEPTIDLPKRNLYTLENCTGCLHGYHHGKLQTIFIDVPDNVPSTDATSNALMFAFGTALAQARQHYGMDVTTLPSPVPIQCVCLTSTGFHFLFFQLNTLNLSSPDGVKNLAWIDTNNELFVRKLPQYWKKDLKPHLTKYESYDSKIFDKFFAIYLNGLEELS